MPPFATRLLRRRRRLGTASVAAPSPARTRGLVDAWSLSPLVRAARRQRGGTPCRPRAGPSSFALATVGRPRQSRKVLSEGPEDSPPRRRQSARKGDPTRGSLDAEEAGPGGHDGPRERGQGRGDVQPRAGDVMRLTPAVSTTSSTPAAKPCIAALAAGVRRRLATLVLVLDHAPARWPMQPRSRAESPHGDGSLSMLESGAVHRPSKILVLCLLGFVATGFIITITLSAADASADLIENPYLKATLTGHQVGVTLTLLVPARRHLPQGVQGGHRDRRRPRRRLPRPQLRRARAGHPRDRQPPD